MDSFWIQQSIFEESPPRSGRPVWGPRLFWRPGVRGFLRHRAAQLCLRNLFSSTYESFAPAGTPAALIEVIPWRTVYVKSAVLSGNRNPFEQDPNGLHFAIRDTPVFASEIGFTHDAEGAVRPSDGLCAKEISRCLQIWRNLQRGQVYGFGGRSEKRNYLIYGMANQAIFRSEAGSNRGLDVTLAFDWSPGDISREHRQITAGVRLQRSDPLAVPETPSHLVSSTRRLETRFAQSTYLFEAPMLGSRKQWN